MKKTIKKFMAALLAVALLCAMAVPAFAAEGTAPAATTGTVTVQNVVSGRPIKFIAFWTLLPMTATTALLSTRSMTIGKILLKALVMHILPASMTLPVLSL